jgi:hypothetical protein
VDRRRGTALLVSVYKGGADADAVALDERHVADPVALASRKTRIDRLSVEARGRAVERRGVDILEAVDVTTA